MAAFAGVLVMLMLGIVRPEHWVRAATNLWSPFVAIAAIMVMTEVALRVGLLGWWASQVEARAQTTSQMFTLVFGLGVLTSAILNNDAAILLLTPLVVGLIRRRFPDRPQMVVPFAFAVFMSAGVAAFPVSNPMNMVVAEFTGVGFNEYALHMFPIALAGWVLGFAILRRLFKDELAVVLESDASETRPATPGQRLMMLLLGGVLIAYSVVGYIGGPVWAVACCGALLALILARGHTQDNPLQIAWQGVSWETLAFLMGVLILSMGLFEVGLVDRLTGLYADAGIATVGAVSAVGSAVLNNHPMSHINMMALAETSAETRGVLAALIGGDLGPRLLPMGSLAGLLWLEMLRRHGIEIGLRQFVKIGVIVTVPTLGTSLAILALF
tara:strand:- start:20312 stop:21463 length:1152 start_codon:yes stop_codon:yes gene_type:complete